MSNLHPWPDYIIRKCIFLSALFLTAALVLSIKADTSPELYPALRHYIQQFQSFAAMVLAAGLTGGVLLEEGLRRQRL